MVFFGRIRLKTLMKFIPLHIEDYMLPCFSKQILGFDCPGCGLQRSIAFLFKGEFAAAWEMYPAIYTVIPLFGLLIADHFYTIKHSNKIIIALVIASLALIISNYISKFN